MFQISQFLNKSLTDAFLCWNSSLFPFALLLLLFFFHFIKVPCQHVLLLSITFRFIFKILNVFCVMQSFLNDQI